jgi:hypothetical protein
MRQPSIRFAAGALYSKVGDLLSCDLALYGGCLLPASERDLLFKPNLDKLWISGEFSSPNQDLPTRENKSQFLAERSSDFNRLFSESLKAEN